MLRSESVELEEPFPKISFPKSLEGSYGIEVISQWYDSLVFLAATMRD